MAMSRAVGGSTLLLLISLSICSVSAREGPRSLLAIQDCKCGCLVRNPFNKEVCSQCKPYEQCKLQEATKCSCDDFVTNKWEIREELENRFCKDQPCKANGCCGGLRYGKQTGGTGALIAATSSAIACAACTAGCGACAGATAAELMKQELVEQVQSIVLAIEKTAEDLSTKASEFGTNLVAQVTDTISDIASEIVRKGKFNRDGARDATSRTIGNCKIAMEPGMNTYSSKTCVYCCNCVNNMNAVQLYFAWRLDCTGGDTSTAPSPVEPPATEPAPETPAEVCKHDCDRFGKNGPCVFGKCTGGCKKCCWTP